MGLGTFIGRLFGRLFGRPAEARDDYLVSTIRFMELDPERIGTPGVYVDRVVQCEPVAVRWDG